MRPHTVILVLCLAVPALAGDAAQPLVLTDHVAADPLMVFVAGGADLGETWDGWMEMADRLAPEEGARAKAEAALAELDTALGCSVRRDLLDGLGPEYAFVLDLPGLDGAAGAIAAGGPAALGPLLTNVGLLARVREPGSLETCLRSLLTHSELEVTETEDGLLRFDLQGFPLYYGFGDGTFALGAAPEFVHGSLAARSVGERLADGADYAKVFVELDEKPLRLTYLNLPKLRRLIEESQIVSGLIDAEPEAKRVAQLVMQSEYTGMGAGSTSVLKRGGMRTTNFGPEGLSGGLGNVATLGIVSAIAVPNFLNAVDRGKQKRTMADIRSIGTAVEMHMIDANAYPGPTAGFEPVGVFAEALSPEYIRRLPEVDGWGHSFMVWSDGESYRIVSPGKDGVFDREWSGPLDDVDGGTSRFTADIVFVNGSFAVWPEGQQE